jgi:hypothetical protein
MCPISKLLLVELVPSTCHYSNVRTTIKPSQWDKIRNLSYTQAQNKCEICNQTGKKQGYKHDLECHEIWEYNDTTHTQTLVGLISLCPICHLTKHIGRAMAMKKEKICYKQLINVNKWTQEQVDEHIKVSFEIHKERSKHEWSLNLSILNAEPYNLKIDLDKKRIFKIKKYKKKRKKKIITKTKKRRQKRPPKK